MQQKTCVSNTDRIVCCNVYYSYAQKHTYISVSYKLWFRFILCRSYVVFFCKLFLNWVSCIFLLHFS